MANDAETGKIKIQGRIPRDEFKRYDTLQEQWGIDNGDAFRRVFSAGLDAVEDKSIREHLKNATVNLAVIGLVMWVIGRVMPNIPQDSATLAAFITWGVAALCIVVIGLLGTESVGGRFGYGSREAAD